MPDDSVVPMLIAGRFSFNPEMAFLRPDVSEAATLLLVPAAIDLLRSDDLLSLRVSFVNLKWLAAGSDVPPGPPQLTRASAGRLAYLVATFPPQHVVERAFFETSPGLAPRPPTDPDAARSADDPLEVPPVWASVSGPTRLVFVVGPEPVTYSIEGLLNAMGRLPLSVGPTALAPPNRRLPGLAESLAGPVDLGALLAGAALRSTRRAGTSRGRRPGATGAPANDVADLATLSRLTATAAHLQHRFGAESALAALAASRLGAARGVPSFREPIKAREVPPLPARPADEHTAIELPWRLVVSPNDQAAWAHARRPVDHDGRVELWHSRMGVRTTVDGHPGVDEHAAHQRAIRAVWARDFDDLAGFGFSSPPASASFPPADGSLDVPKVRSALTSRDRMMLVHETSNFRLTRNGKRGWVPPVVPTERLILSPLGGWLRSRLVIDELPDGGLTIEEWKHHAAMGRDHEVKVVYAGFLLPFGHRASLVKVTQRKIARGRAGTPACLFQRMFIVVREPEKSFGTSGQVLDGGQRPDNQMPLSTVRIATEATPDIEAPVDLPGGSPVGSGLMFVPRVGGADFGFKIVAVDLEGNLVEFQAPMVFMERDRNQAPRLQPSVAAHNELPGRSMSLGGQKMAYAPSATTDDTTLNTSSLVFDVVARPDAESVSQDEPRFLPILRTTSAVVPAMSALAGATAPVSLKYPDTFKAGGISGTGNVAEVFLEVEGEAAPMDFGGQGDRSGGLVTPSVLVTGLSRRTGPIGGSVADAASGTFDPAGFFGGLGAKLFGVVELEALLRPVGFSAATVPTFVARTLDLASTLASNVDRLRAATAKLSSSLGSVAHELGTAASKLHDDLVLLAKDPAHPPDLAADLGSVNAALGPFVTGVSSLPGLPRAEREQVVAIAGRVQDQLGAGAIGAAAETLTQAARGFKLPEVVAARLDWATDIQRWPQGSTAESAIISPVDAAGKPVAAARLTLAVEIQAPTREGMEPSALASCSITPFDLRLVGPVPFVILHFETLEFSMAAGKKPDVNVAFRKDNGIEFGGPLSFVNTLRDIIPFDGFSDPPYLDVTSDGINAGFDLPVPSLAVGVLSLENVNLGANLKVPFIGESLEVSFNFCTRENPFRLTVMAFGGGGFFGITLTPAGVRMLEAAFEFGAAISMNFGVASGGVSVMAGIYFRLESSGNETSVELSGYFRLRGEVDVLGLISASIELYLELTYEETGPGTGKAVGRATLTVEVEVALLSFSVDISCEKKLAGANSDPTFAEEMGLPSGSPPGAARPWDQYCVAFA